jgi:hypothetical protein
MMISIGLLLWWCYKQGYLNFREVEDVLDYFVRIDCLHTGERSDGMISLFYPASIDNGQAGLLEKLTNEIHEELFALSGDESLFVKINPFK